MDNKNINEEVFECKMYITDLETNKKSKEINVSDLVFNDYIEFEFGNYEDEDEDYGTLPYKDFKFFINDYAVTFYSPQYKKKCEELDQYKKKCEELDRYKNNWEELKKWLNEYVETNTKWYNNDLSHYDKKYYEQIYSNTDFMLRKVLIQMKELEEKLNEK